MEPAALEVPRRVRRARRGRRSPTPWTDPPHQPRTAARAAMSDVRLGLRENLAQFSLLVLVNAFVGAMVGMERSILPAIAEQEFHLAAKHRGALVHRGVRRHQGAHELPRGALVRPLRAQARARRRVARRRPGALPADVGAELGVGALRQRAAGREPGAHLVDHRHHEDRPRGPEEARARDGAQRVRGYFAVASAPSPPASSPRATAAPGALLPRASATSRWAGCSRLFVVRETKHHVAAESKLHGRPPGGLPTQREVFWRTTLSDRTSRASARRAW
jgi:hypothetical protein